MDNVLQFTTRVDLSGAKAGLADLAAEIQDQMQAATASVADASASIASSFESQSAAAAEASGAISEAFASIKDSGSEAFDQVSSAAAESAASVTDSSSASAEAVVASSDIQKAAYAQLATATLELATARRQVSDAQGAYLAGELPAADAETLLAEAMERATGATEQLAAAKANLADVTQYLTARTSVEIETEVADAGAKAENAEATNLLSQAETRSASATRGTISARQAASAELRTLEGGSRDQRERQALY